jgi:PEP-CTERM motif
MKASHFVAITSLVFVSPALADTLIVPGPGTGNAQGPTPFNYYGSSGSRVQEIYASSFFSGAELIDGFSFRAYPGAAPSFFFGNSVDISDAVIQLSTTSAGTDESGSLPSATFADNLGSDATTVYSGALDLTTAATGTGPQPFDYTVSFSTPFLYNPADGNLLLDVTIPSGATVSGGGFGFLTFDTVNTVDDGIYSVVNVSDGDATTGTLSTAGAITAFSVGSVGTLAVPEPSTWIMMVTGFGILSAAMWKRRSASTDPKAA